MTDVAVVLLDGKAQVLAGEELVFGNEAMKTFPVVGQERVAFEADFIEKFLTEILWGERRGNDTIVAVSKPTGVPHATGQ